MDDPGLRKASRKRDILFRKTVGSYNKFIIYRNAYNTIKRNARTAYYTDLLQEYQSDIRKTSQVLNNITGRSRDKTNITDTFIINGERVNDRPKIANEFCTYFSNIGKSFAQAIPSSNATSNSYMGNDTNQSTMFLSPTYPEEICKIMKKYDVTLVIFECSWL